MNSTIFQNQFSNIHVVVPNTISGIIGSSMFFQSTANPTQWSWFHAYHMWRTDGDTIPDSLRRIHVGAVTAEISPVHLFHGCLNTRISDDAIS